MLVCRVFPAQTFAINMQIKTALFIALALAAGCASAANSSYIGCYYDTNWATQPDFPTFFCSNGKYGGGCVADPNIPAGGVAIAAGYAMTVTTCNGQCQGFKYFGLQDGFSCQCGNDYGKHGGGKAPESDCNMACTGSSAEICGAGAHNSVYAVTPVPHYSCDATTGQCKRSANGTLSAEACIDSCACVPIHNCGQWNNTGVLSCNTNITAVNVCPACNLSSWITPGPSQQDTCDRCVASLCS
jgi:hypothetical protein